MVLRWSKGKGSGGRGEHGNKERLGSKGAAQGVRQHEEDERVQMAPNMVAGGSHFQAMADPGEEEATEEERQRNEEKEEILRVLRG